MTTKRVKLESTPTPPPADGEDGDHCIICLQDIVDRTVLPGCSHDCFCFDCVVVWTEQSRKCPLCQQAIGPYLVHHVRSHLDSTKFYLPPLRSSPSPDQPSRVLNQRHPNTRSARIRAWGRREGGREEGAEHRALERRRWVYRHGCYAKHVASNSYTKYRPYPAPTQFAAQADLVNRTTAFVRRELMVWDNIDADFLTTFVISLMKSIDLRSEVAIKLLSEFLDMGGSYVEGNRYPNAEHFVHEVYSYIRSPFRELSVYDAQVQYDRPSSLVVVERQPRPTAPVRTRPPLNVNESLSSRGFRPPSNSRSRSYSRHPKQSDSPERRDENSQRTRSPSRHRRKRSRSSSCRSSQSIRYRSSSPARGRRGGSHLSPSPSRSPSPSDMSRLQGQDVASRHQEIRPGTPLCQTTSSEGDALLRSRGAATAVFNEPRKDRVPPRAPRQTALSSIHAHLGLSGQRKVKIDRRPLAERVATMEGSGDSTKATDLDTVTVAATVDQAFESDIAMNQSLPEDEQVSQAAERRLPSEVMALTRARLAALKTQTQPDTEPLATQKAIALRALLFARLEEERKKSATMIELVEARPDAEERRLRLAAKLAAEKRRASASQAFVPVQK